VPWPHRKRCPKCAAESDRLERQFWERVFFGDYDVDGYTPNERKALERAK
jgi:hypothetical protein